MSRQTLTGANQNVGNKLGAQPSVKLHAPPGGASSFSLGWGSEPVEPAARNSGRRAAPQQHIQSAPQHGVSSTNSSTNAYGNSGTVASSFPAHEHHVTPHATENMYAPQHAVVEQPQNISGAAVGLSSNAFATGSNQNSGNFITERRTTKVAAPPGGRSSIVFG